MALQKDFVTKQGVTANYHRVTDNQNIIEVDVFLNSEARQDKTSLQRLHFEKSFTEDELKVDGKSRKVLAYEYLKGLSEYSSAVDV